VTVRGRFDTKPYLDVASSLYSTSFQSAEASSHWIVGKLKTHGIDAANSTITDATAGIGGNTMSFIRHFRRVNAVECQLNRRDFLTYNLELAAATSKGKHNWLIYTGDYRKYMDTLKRGYGASNK